MIWQSTRKECIFFKFKWNGKMTRAHYIHPVQIGKIIMFSLMLKNNKSLIINRNSLLVIHRYSPLVTLVSPFPWLLIFFVIHIIDVRVHKHRGKIWMQMNLHELIELRISNLRITTFPFSDSLLFRVGIQVFYGIHGYGWHRLLTAH